MNICWLTWVASERVKHNLHSGPEAMRFSGIDCKQENKTRVIASSSRKYIGLLWVLQYISEYAVRLASTDEITLRISARHNFSYKLT